MAQAALMMTGTAVGMQGTKVQPVMQFALKVPCSNILHLLGN
jgi:hypothetical protein